MVHYIDTTAQKAELLLQELAAHIPPVIDLGRPLVISQDAIVTTTGGTTAMISVEERGGGAWRIAELRGGKVELTEWISGRETDRRIIRGGYGEDDADVE